MPVQRKWYRVDCILGKKWKDGIVHYHIKWLNYKKSSWEPHFHVGDDLIREFEHLEREKQNRARHLRWVRRNIKKELGEPLPEMIPVPRRNRRWFVNV